MASSQKIKIAIDRGGTFTDCLGIVPGRKEGDILVKLLSQDPKNYKDAPREGVRRILEIARGTKIAREEQIQTDDVEWIRLSTTVATNALLERKGEKHALLITKGFKDLVQIGNQSRPRIFDLAIRKPDVLYSTVVEVDERVTLVGYTSDPNAEANAVKFDEEGKVLRKYKDGKEEDVDGASEEWKGEIIRGLSGEAVQVLKKPDLTQVKKDLQKLYDEDYRTLAIVFIHSYTYPEHELQVGALAKEVGFKHVSISSQLMPMIKMVPRGTSTTADAYLTPVLKAYIDGFFDGFDPSLRSGKAGTRVEFMMSDGGLTEVDRFSGLKSIISGPAGGVVGFALTSWDEKNKTPVIGLDMGGTSTDVSRFDGRYEHIFETTIAGVSIQSPQLDLNTVAAGGGSRLFFRNGLFNAGPESAGAHPGPTCYRKGGPLTITDANLVLGRLVPEHFPKIFGPNENEGLDLEASKGEFSKLREQINRETGKDLSLDEVAWGFIKVANETMCRPIRTLTEARGYSTSKHILASFGGAGGQHACAIASTLGIQTVLVHRYSSILSAYGMALADRVNERQEPSSETWDGENGEALKRMRKRIDILEREARVVLTGQGFSEERVKSEIYLNMRYEGTDTSLMILKPESDWDFEREFVNQYKQEFGFLLTDKRIVIDDVRVRAIGKTFDSLGESVFEETSKTDFKPISSSAGGENDLKSEGQKSVYFEGTGRVQTPVWSIARMKKGDLVEGPAILLDETQTIVVDPKCTAKITSKHVWIDVRK